MDLLNVLLVVAITICSLVYLYFYNAYKYWERRGFPYLEPTFPKGNSNKFIKFSKNLGLETAASYVKIKKRSLKFAGIYIISRPVLLVVDPDIVGDILTKDFSYFVDRGSFYNEKADPIGAHLFNLNAHAWRDMRIKLTPTFTSGKMKMMFNSIVSHSENLVKAFDNHVNKGEEIDIKDLSANFTTDVIGSCAFGLDMKSFDQNEAEFRKYGRLIFKPEGIFHLLRLTVCLISPPIATALGFGTHRKDCTEFFTTLIKQTVKNREENKVYRPDFLQLLIDMKNNQVLTIDQIVAQAFLFFEASFETSSLAMTFALYELAIYEHLQDKLRNEINDVLAKYDDEITYENIKEMTYLQQVLAESMRLYPPVINLTRTCVKDYKIRNTDLVLEKGTSIAIPLIGIHLDSEYYPKPLRFNPDRFTKDNKNKMHNFVHLPFGDGPRNCIGLRFGLTQTKIGLIQILRNFRVTLTGSTPIPVTLSENTFLSSPNETVYLKAERIRN